MNAMGCRPWRWRFDLRTGRTREEPLAELCCEFPTIHAQHRGRAYRYVVAATGAPGWFLFDGLVRLDVETGAVQRFRFPDGVFASEAPVAPRPGGAEDDGWIVTFVSDVPRDRSECWVFDAAHLADGPVARVALPSRICAGTHACFTPS
jgi:carotenoid cleavage dioxygenase